MTTTEKVIVFATALANLERHLNDAKRHPFTHHYWGGVIDGVGDVARDLLTPPVWIELDRMGERLARLWVAAGIDPQEARERWLLAGMGREIAA